MSRLVEHLRRQLGDAAAETGGLGLVVDLLLAEPEVREFGVALFVEHDVVGLEVALNDVVGVQVLDGQQDFGDVELGGVFVELLQFVQDLAQVAAGALLHDEEQLLGGLEGLEEFDDEGVLDLGEDVALCLGLAREVAAHDLLLAQHLHGLEALLALLLNQLHLAETAFAEHHVRHEVLRDDLLVLELGVLVLADLDGVHVVYVLHRRFEPVRHVGHPRCVPGCAQFALFFFFLFLL